MTLRLVPTTGVRTAHAEELDNHAGHVDYATRDCRNLVVFDVEDLAAAVQLLAGTGETFVVLPPAVLITDSALARFDAVSEWAITRGRG